MLSIRPSPNERRAGPRHAYNPSREEIHVHLPLARAIRRLTILSAFAVGAAMMMGHSQADEGLWLFNELPKEYLKKHYNFTATDEWADHLMKASVRFNVGGSASFVSSNGLVLTNHHVGSDTLQKVSTPEHNYYRDG